MKPENLKVVVFGSALLNPESARDVDVAVAYKGESWDEQYGINKPDAFQLTEGLLVEYCNTAEPSALTDAIRNAIVQRKLDMHFTYMEATPMPGTVDLKTIRVAGPGSVPTGGVRIPAPWGIEVPALAITPDTEIERIAVLTIPAAIRAFQNDAEKMSLAIESLMVGVALPFNGSSQIDIGGPYADHGDEWDTYVVGLRALRNAVSHAPAWKQAQFPGKRLLARLNASGPSREGIGYARNLSNHPRARLFLRPDGVDFSYGSLIDYRTAEELFVR